jgi:hypothetical protein
MAATRFPSVAPGLDAHAQPWSFDFRFEPCHIVTEMRRNVEIKGFFFSQKTGTSQVTRRWPPMCQGED